jgi:steroid delta-isomerase-like uncharacterized protein
MQLTTNKVDIMEQCLNAVDTHNLEPIPSLYNPTARIDAPGATLAGTEQILAWYGVFVRAFPDIKHEVRGTVQEGDTCVLQARATGTHTGPLASPAGDIPPTGKSFVLDYVNVAQFKDGGIASEMYYWDNQSFLTQLGLI